MSFEDVKEQVAVANRILAELGLAAGVTASAGHASMRVPGQTDRFVVKGRGYRMDALARMRAEDMVVCDLDGFRIEGPPGISQCFEVKIHSCLYRTYPGVLSVVHVHPRFVVLMGTTRQLIRPLSNAGGPLVRKPVPVFPHNYLILSDEEGMGVANLMADSKVLILRGHGAVSTGVTLEESVTNMLRFEEQARMNWLALSALGPNYGYIEEEMYNEPRPRRQDLPHFKDWPEGGSGVSEGLWTYFSDLVS